MAASLRLDLEAEPSQEGNDLVARQPPEPRHALVRAAAPDDDPVVRAKSRTVRPHTRGSGSPVLAHAHGFGARRTSAAPISGDIRAETCDLGHFFSSPEAAAAWLETLPGGTVEEDFDIHRRVLEQLGWNRA